MGSATAQAMFFAKLAALLKANLPLLKAMEVSLERVKDEWLRGALSRILDRAYQGSSLSDAFNLEAEVFSTEVLYLISSGEEAGDLELKVQALADGLAAGTFEPRPADGEGAPPLLVLIDRAVEAQATDLHITPAGAGAEVRFRIGGKLLPQDDLGAADLADFVERAHLLAGLPAEPVTVPRSGEFDAAAMRVTASFCLVPEGESVVLSLTVPDTIAPPLPDLGFNEEQIEVLLEWSRRPNGIILVAGLPGSGREKLLRSLVAGMDSEASRVFAVTAEPMPRISGISRISAASISRSAALRAVLGQDLDCVMIDELEDRATVLMAARVARTGHLVLAGIRAREAPEALAALLDLGFDPEDVEQLVIGVAVLPAASDSAEIFAIDQGACRAISEKK